MYQVRNCCLLLLFCFATIAKAQEPIQFSGLIVSGDSATAVPYTNILIQNKLQGTISNFDGYFSFVVEPKDSIVFSCIGYKRAHYIIPKGYQKESLIRIQKLEVDAILVSEIDVTPWSNYEQFKYAFVNAKIKDDDIQKAKNNLSKEVMQDLRLSMNAISDEIQKNMMRSQAYGIENQGMPPTLSFTNPMNWIGLIKMIGYGSIKDFYSNDN
jgi:hypothetical protein